LGEVRCREETIDQVKRAAPRVAMPCRQRSQQPWGSLESLAPWAAAAVGGRMT
jgi:hypothetical protein